MDEEIEALEEEKEKMIQIKEGAMDEFLNQKGLILFAGFREKEIAKQGPSLVNR